MFHSLRGNFLLLSGALLLVSCNQNGISGSGENATLFKINGQTVHKNELSMRNKMALYQEEDDQFRRRQQAMEGIAAEHMMDFEAKKLGITKEELSKREIDDKVPLVTPAEVDDFLKENKARIEEQIKSYYKGKDKPSNEEIKKVITQQLESKHKRDRYQSYMNELQQKYKVEFLDKAPSAPRVEVAAGDNPKMGPDNAKVTIIEFSDFQCPYCARAVPIIKQVEKEYGDKVRIVFRDFPLSFHDTAQEQAEAAACANEQGKFWAFHDILFDRQSQDMIKVSHDKNKEEFKKTLAELAKKAEIDEQKFLACFDSDKYTKDIEKDIQAGMEAGVRSTPSFFINGRIVAGALPFPEFKKIIDEELAK